MVCTHLEYCMQMWSSYVKKCKGIRGSWPYQLKMGERFSCRNDYVTVGAFVWR